MSHRLLQLAATAAGFHYNPTRRDVRGLWIVRPDARCQEDQILWNPLKDGKQAYELRRLFKLFVIPHDRDYPFVVVQDLAVTIDIAVDVKIGEDAALRRATVLAAAELGKRKK